MRNSPVPDTDAPGILIAEDDPTSRMFLAEALAGLGCRTVECEDGPSALEQARLQRFDILLLDCRMPGAGAEAVLAGVRGDSLAASRCSPAIATSAEVDEALDARLRLAGFACVLPKPMQVSALQDALAGVLADWPSPRLLDDAAALGSSGDAATMKALRNLFDGELRHMLIELDELAMRPQLLVEQLHRLRASCGFCGAVALARQAERMKRSMDAGETADADALARLRETIVATIDALSASG